MAAVSCQHAQQYCSHTQGKFNTNRSTLHYITWHVAHEKMYRQVAAVGVEKDLLVDAAATLVAKTRCYWRICIAVRTVFASEFARMDRACWVCERPAVVRSKSNS